MNRQLIIGCQVAACITMMVLMTSLSAVAGESEGNDVSAATEQGTN